MTEKKTPLTAVPFAAGVLRPGDDFTVERTEPDGRHLSYQEKGGWITLDWEKKPGEYKIRTLAVSRGRAVQALDALEGGHTIV